MIRGLWSQHRRSFVLIVPCSPVISHRVLPPNTNLIGGPSTNVPVQQHQGISMEIVAGKPDSKYFEFVTITTPRGIMYNDIKFDLHIQYKIGIAVRFGPMIGQIGWSRQREDRRADWCRQWRACWYKRSAVGVHSRTKTRIRRTESRLHLHQFMKWSLLSETHNGAMMLNS